MKLSDSEKRNVLDEKEQTLKQIQVYSDLVKSNSGWFGYSSIAYEAKELIISSLKRITELDLMLSEK